MQFNQLWEKHFREFQERCLTLPDGSSLVLVGVCGKDYASELSTNKVAEFLQEQRWRRGIVYIGLGIRCFGRDMSADEEAEVLRSYPADKLASDPLNIDCRFFQLTDFHEFRAVGGEVRGNSLVWEDCYAELGRFSLQRFLVSQPSRGD